MVRRLLLLLLIVIGMSGCTMAWEEELPGETGSAPEDAVFDWMQDQPPVVANSLAIRQVLEIDQERAPVLATYRPEGWTYSLPALALFLVEKDNGRWVTTDPYHSEYPGLIDQVLTYDDLSEEKQGTISAVYGLVVDEKVVHVDILWDDELEQAVQVVNGSYLSVRTDKTTVRGVKVAAYDTAGNVLAEFAESRANN